MEAIDVGFGDERDDPAVPDRPRLRRRSGRRRRPRGRHRALRAPAVARAARAGDRARPRRRRADAAAGAHARDPRPDPPARATRPRGSTAARRARGSSPGDILRLPDLADTLRGDRAPGAAALYRGERARAIVATVRDGGGELTLDDLAAYRVVWRRPVRVALPRPRGALEPAAVVGRRPDRLRARAARAAAGRGRPGAPRRSRRSPR